MYNKSKHHKNRKREAGAIIRGIAIAEGRIREQREVKMAASLRVLAKGKTMQPVLRAIITRTCPVVYSRGLSLTSKLISSLFKSCLDWSIGKENRRVSATHFHFAGCHILLEYCYFSFTENAILFYTVWLYVDFIF